MNERIKEMILEHGTKKDFSGPVTEQQINQFEEESGIYLPVQYKQYIRLLGSGGILGMEISGISENGPSLIKNTARYRNIGLPSDFIVIYPMDDFAMCMSSKDLSSDSPVYSWTIGADYPEIEYKSFDNFLEVYFQDRIDNL